MINKIKINYRSDIDGMRALAILGVVLYHFFPNIFVGGFAGVDIFFVISGFIISRLIFKEIEINEFSLIKFYFRRIKRIIPALLLILITSIIFGLIFFHPYELKSLGENIIAATFFYSNLLLMNNIGYFDQSNDVNILSHLWSLAVEEQFYIFYPLFIIFFIKFKKFYFLLISLSFLSILSCLILSKINPVFSFYLPFTRFWELCFGSILAFLSIKKKQNTQSSYKNIIAFLGLSLLIMFFFFYDEKSIIQNSQWPNFYTFIPVIGTGLIIFANSTTFTNSKILGNRFMVFIGLISYPLYLWHWIILVIYRFIENENAIDYKIKTLLILLSFFLSYLTFKFIETPIRSNKTNQMKHSIYLLACLFGCGLLGFLFKYTDGLSFRYNIKDLILYKYNYEKDFRSNVCHLNSKDTEENFSNVCNDNKKKINVFLFGDSTVAHLYKGLSISLEPHIYGLSQYTSFGCPPIKDFKHPTLKNCYDTNNFVLKKIISTKPEVVVMSTTTAKMNKQLINSFLDTAEYLKKNGIKKIIIVGTNLYFTDRLQNILAKSIKTIPNNYFIKRGVPKNNNDYLIENEAKRRGLTFISIIKSMCSKNNECLAMHNGIPTVFDGTHFTDSGSFYFSHFLKFAIANYKSEEIDYDNIKKLALASSNFKINSLSKTYMNDKKFKDLTKRTFVELNKIKKILNQEKKQKQLFNLLDEFKINLLQNSFSNTELWIKLITAYRDFGEYKKAITTSEEALTILVNNPYIYNLRARSYLDLKNYEKAILDIDKAILINKNYFEFHYSNFLIQMGKKDYQKALKIASYLKKSAKGNQALILALFSHANASQKIGNRSAAKTDYEQILKLQPDNDEAKRFINSLK